MFVTSITLFPGLSLLAHCCQCQNGFQRSGRQDIVSKVCCLEPSRTCDHLIDVLPHSFASSKSNEPSRRVMRSTDSLYYASSGDKLRGKCLIFNFEKFNHPNNKNLPERKGSSKDVTRLREVFGGTLKFDVQTWKNLTHSELTNQLKIGKIRWYCLWCLLTINFSRIWKTKRADRLSGGVFPKSWQSQRK